MHRILFYDIVTNTLALVISRTLQNCKSKWNGAAESFRIFLTLQTMKFSTGCSDLVWTKPVTT